MKRNGMLSAFRSRPPASRKVQHNVTHGSLSISVSAEGCRRAAACNSLTRTQLSVIGVAIGRKTRHRAKSRYRSKMTQAVRARLKSRSTAVSRLIQMCYLYADRDHLIPDLLACCEVIR